MNERLREAGRFLVVLLVVFVIVYGIFAWGVGWKPLTDLTAMVSATGLESLGMRVNVVTGSETILLVNDYTILISELCTGWFEIALLIAAMVATLHATRRQKIMGIVGALMGGFLVNQVRVMGSIGQVVHTNLDWANFTHDVLFRASMLFVMLGLYAVWLKWVNENSISKRKKHKKGTNVVG